MTLKRTILTVLVILIIAAIILWFVSPETLGFIIGYVFGMIKCIVTGGRC
jgi:hypothetical protein